MARRIIIIIAIVLSVTTYAQTQYIDFFQSFSTFIQPTTRRPETTKRPNKQTSKRYQDTIFFESDDFLTQRQNGRHDTTTVKPRKIKTTKPHQIERNYNIDKYNRLTQRPYYIAQMIPNYTTINPLLYRPGVRPALVDENRPPITNRPVTYRPTGRPIEGATIEIGPDEDSMSEAEKKRFLDIAEQKCDEYKSLSKKKLVALPLASIHPSPGVELEVDTCAPNTAPLILGGKVVNIQEFPHMALVGWKNIQKSGYTWKCGGSLVSEKYVMTAGHCTYHDKDYNVISGPPSAVQLGSSYLDGSDALVVTIRTVIRHPKYKERRSYYDVALVKLQTNVKFSSTIRPACLGVPPAVGNRIVTTGWGRTEFGGDSSQELRAVSLPIWEMDECRSVWGTSRKMPEGPSAVSQLCAGEREGGKDTCQGDSGGPAQIQDGCLWRIVAVTSVGRSCGAKETPALYAKVPRMFIAAEIFADVQLNNSYNGNNNGNNRYGDQTTNRYDNNRYNNQADRNIDNNRYNNQDNRNNDNNRYDNQGTANRYNENNNNNNQEANNRYNNRETNTDEIRRPGNHQTIWSNIGTRQSQTNRNANDWTDQNNQESRPGNHQSLNKQNTENRQIQQTENIKYFATSHTTKDSEIRLGNHQTANNRKEIPNYFVTSHAVGDTDAILTGNHQRGKNKDYFVDGNQKTDRTDNKYFLTRHTEDKETLGLLGNHQRGSNLDSQISETTLDVAHVIDDENAYGVVNYDHKSTYKAQSYPLTTENIYNVNNNAYNVNNNAYNVNNNAYNVNNNAYNVNNNAYNVNNNAYNLNRGYAVANRPWWTR